MITDSTILGNGKKSTKAAALVARPSAKGRRIHFCVPALADRPRDGTSDCWKAGTGKYFVTSSAVICPGQETTATWASHTGAAICGHIRPRCTLLAAATGSRRARARGRNVLDFFSSSQSRSHHVSAQLQSEEQVGSDHDEQATWLAAGTIVSRLQVHFMYIIFIIMFEALHFGT